MTRTSFSGFPKALPSFLASLARNNNRQWFEANKSEYRSVVVEPALAFIAAMEPLVSAFSPVLKAEARLNGSLRRIHRDVRFSKDKTPYNPQLHIIFWAGTHPNRSPACHVVHGPKYMGIGAGQWCFDKNNLHCYRTSLMDREKLTQLTKAIEIASRDGQILDEPVLKRLPKGFDGAEAVGIQAELLLQKAILVRNHNETYDMDIFNRDCPRYIEKRLRASHAVNTWLAESIA